MANILRPAVGGHHKTMRLRTDELEAIVSFAKAHQLTWNGAVRELIRTHPRIQLPSLMDGMTTPTPSPQSNAHRN